MPRRAADHRTRPFGGHQLHLQLASDRVAARDEHLERRDDVERVEPVEQHNLCMHVLIVGRTDAKDQWRIGHNPPTCCQRVDHYGWVTTGAHVVIDRLIAGGVDVCFANPGTSEMHFVAALDSAPQMRAVLCLFEGVATGAADGYARIAGRPAATLLHLGPGMANGLANLHNARRAHSPVVNIVGDHATYHQKLDAPLQSDIDALGDWLQGTVHRPASAAELGKTVDAAVAAAGGGHIATLILPADLSWSESNFDGPPTASTPSQAAPLDGERSRRSSTRATPTARLPRNYPSRSGLSNVPCITLRRPWKC